ncbi:MAG: flagellar assembly protein FliX [Rhodospirillales bacterium]
MKIKNTGGAGKTGKTGETRPVRRAGAAAAGEFSDQVRATQGADAAASAAPAAGAGALAGVDGILAAQDVGGVNEDDVRRQVRDYGDKLLDYLDTIREGLLLGFVPMENLANLAQTMRQRRLATADPKLQEIIAEIELRAEVELAKLSRRG